MAELKDSPVALLMTRLSQAEQLVLRDMYRWIPISEASFVDNQGQLYLPGGQEVTLRLVHSAGKAALLHTCLVASAAEIDFVLRAVAFYRANGSAMLDITPLIVTLSIDANSKKVAEEYGILVSINGASPLAEPAKAQRSAERLVSPTRSSTPEHVRRSTKTGSGIRGRPRAGSDEDGATKSSSGSAIGVRGSYVLSPSVVASAINAAPRTPAMTTPSTSDDSLNAVTPPAASKLGSVSAAGSWLQLLIAAGIDAAIVPQIADILVQGGVEVPADLSTLPWERMKDLGIKMGQLTRLQKYVAARPAVGKTAS